MSPRKARRRDKPGFLQPALLNRSAREVLRSLMLMGTAFASGATTTRSL